MFSDCMLVFTGWQVVHVCGYNVYWLASGACWRL